MPMNAYPKVRELNLLDNQYGFKDIYNTIMHVTMD